MRIPRGAQSLVLLSSYSTLRRVRPTGEEYAEDGNGDEDVDDEPISGDEGGVPVPLVSCCAGPLAINK